MAGVAVAAAAPPTTAPFRKSRRPNPFAVMAFSLCPVLPIELVPGCPFQTAAARGVRLWRVSAAASARARDKTPFAPAKAGAQFFERSEDLASGSPLPRGRTEEIRVRPVQVRACPAALTLD